MRDKIVLIQITEKLRETQSLEALRTLFSDFKAFCAQNIEMLVYTDESNRVLSAEIKIDNAFVFSKITDPQGLSLHVSGHIYTHKMADEKTFGFEPINCEQDILYEKAFRDIRELIMLHKGTKFISSSFQIGK
jgi:hypothetical protein